MNNNPERITLSEQNYGIVHLKPTLYDFIIKREKLDTKDPVLNLNGRSVIKYELRELCKSIDELQYYDVNRKIYSCSMRFIPDVKCFNMGKIYLDGHSTVHFNRFIFLLRNEIAQEYADARLKTIKKPKIQSFKDFVELYSIHHEEFDYEHLRRDITRINSNRQSK